jgi:hypothetical protein
MSQCAWMSDGERCRFPGTMAEATTGTDRWFCAHHFRSPGMAAGREIVQRSLRWDALPNKAEAWVEARRKQVYGEGDPPAVRKLREQIAAHGRGERVGIASSRLQREPGED